MKWVELRRKTHTAYRSEDKKYLLSPITAPLGSHLPKFVLYTVKPGNGSYCNRVDRFCGTFFKTQYATDWIEKRKVT